ncbi:MAG TPA: hypothetical protein VIK78_19760 [Ruminiclostridium sp.]
MKTKGYCLAIFLRLLDEATRKGISIPESKNADYKDKFNYFLNEASTYVAQLVKIPAVFTVTQNSIKSQLGLFSGFDVQQYLPGDNKIYTQTGTKSLYFEMDNIGAVTIAINGIVTKTINNTIKRVFTPYKFNTGATSTDIVTVTFTGLYPYNIRNVALYAYAFPTDEDVQVYSPFVAYDMPSDFLEFDTVIIKSDPRIYEAYISFKWENNKKVILNHYDVGSFDIHYYRYPKVILPTDVDTTLLDLEDKAIDLVVLQAGIMATTADNQALSAWLRSLFGEKVQNITNSNSVTETSIQTVFSMG